MTTGRLGQTVSGPRGELRRAAARIGHSATEHLATCAHVIKALEGQPHHADLDALIAAARSELEFPQSSPKRDRNRRFIGIAKGGPSPLKGPAVLIMPPHRGRDSPYVEPATIATDHHLPQPRQTCSRSREGRAQGRLAVSPA
jgi:hypothetical protein